MTFVSLADACRCLGVDAKTLHRWLDDAQFPLHSHPRDGRKKGVSGEHLDLLARLHHRSLVSPSQQPPPGPADQPPLSAALLALPETLDALQAQITVLQQQIAELTHVLKPQVRSPSLPAASAQPTIPVRRATKPAPVAPRARPATPAIVKMPPRPVHVIPRVEYGKEGRYVVICPKRGLLPLEPDTPEWFAWVAKQSSFRFVGKLGHFTAHHEWRVPKGAWRAHRHLRNHNHIVRLAPNQELTIAVLEQAADALQAHLTTL